MRIAQLPVGLAGRLAVNGDFGVAESNHAEQQGAAEAAERSSERHEGEEHQHSAIAFKAAGVEDFDPGQPGADAKRRTAERAQHQTEDGKQRDFHGRVFAPRSSHTPRLVVAGAARFNAMASMTSRANSPRVCSSSGWRRRRVRAPARPGQTYP